MPAIAATATSGGARPSNPVRSFFHLLAGGASLAVTRFFDKGLVIGIAAVVVVAAWSMEMSRKRSTVINDGLMRLFHAVAHPEERHRVNSSTWYVTALLLLACLAYVVAPGPFGGPALGSEVGILVLAVADPAAAFIGRRFGRTPLGKRRSLEGTLAFFLTAALSSLVWLSAFSALPWPSKVILSMAAGSIGSLTELVSTRLDDNFTIPVATAASFTIVRGILGV